MTMTEYPILVVGIGPGHPDYVLPAAQRAIAKARVLVGGKRVLTDFAPLSGADLLIPVTGDLVSVLTSIREVRCESSVTVLVSGDPGYYSLLDALRRTFPPASIRVIPGINSLQFAFARLALPWHDAKLLSFHGRQPEESTLAYIPGTVLGMLTDYKQTSREIAAELLAHGWPETARMTICARLSYEDETIETVTLREAAEGKRCGGVVLIVQDVKACQYKTENRDNAECTGWKRESAEDTAVDVNGLIAGMSHFARAAESRDERSGEHAARNR